MIKREKFSLCFQCLKGAENERPTDAGFQGLHQSSWFAWKAQPQVDVYISRLSFSREWRCNRQGGLVTRASDFGTCVFSFQKRFICSKCGGQPLRRLHFHRHQGCLLNFYQHIQRKVPARQTRLEAASGIPDFRSHPSSELSWKHTLSISIALPLVIFFVLFCFFIRFFSPSTRFCTSVCT